MPMNPRIKAAKERFKRDVEDLKETVREEYPVGTYLYATVGNHRLHLCVEQGPSAWGTHSPSVIQVRNTHTGKMRSLDVFYEAHDIYVITKP